MSEYVKQTWEDGVSPVNAERLNHMEEGIANAGTGGSGGGCFDVRIDLDHPDTSVGEDGALCGCDKSLSEILNAHNQGKLIRIVFDDKYIPVTGVDCFDGVYAFTAYYTMFGYPYIMRFIFQISEYEGQTTGYYRIDDRYTYTRA